VILVTFFGKSDEIPSKHGFKMSASSDFAGQ
jgi:hypothetical protein